MFDERQVVYRDWDGDEHNAYDYLLKDGNLAVPGGAYGSDTIDCAAVACAIFEIQNRINGRDDDHVDGLEGCMSAVVNSSDDVGLTLVRYGYVLADDDADADFIALAFLGQDGVEEAKEYEKYAYGE